MIPKIQNITRFKDRKKSKTPRAVEFEVMIDGIHAGLCSWFSEDDFGGCGPWVEGDGSPDVAEAVGMLGCEASDASLRGDFSDRETKLCDVCGACDNGNIVDGVCPECAGD